MTLRRGVALLSCLLLAGAVLTACGGGNDGVETSARDTATTTTDSGTPATNESPAATTPSGTVARDAAGTDLSVVFLDGAKLATGHRRVAPTQAVARAALEQLIAGPNATETGTGFHTVVRPQTSVTGLGVASGVASVTLSPALDQGVDAATAHQAMGQVVFTLTQFPTVQSVRFGTGGTEMTRADFADITPLIFVESVAPGDAIASPVKVAGMANTFEANVRIRILGADGSVLADTFTTATSGSGTWGTFAVNVPFAKGAQTAGTVVLFESSPKDGSMVNVVEVPVTFS